MIDLYFWTTDNCYKARMMLEELGLPYALKLVNLGNKEQFSPDFLKISPGHKLPAIVDPDGPGGAAVSICESGAILKYLAEKADNALYPAAPMARIVTDQWFFYGTSTFTPLAQQRGTFYARFPEDVPAAKKWYGDTLMDLYDVLNKRLAEAEYLAGGEYTIADISVYPDVQMHDYLGVDLEPYPHLSRWNDAIAARPATQRAWAPID